MRSLVHVMFLYWITVNNIADKIGEEDVTQLVILTLSLAIAGFICLLQDFKELMKK